MILPGKLPLEFYLCNGTNPDQIYPENRMNYPLLITFIVSLVINGFVPVKIRRYQMKNKGTSLSKDTDHSSTNLTDLTTNTILLVVISCAVASLFSQYRIKPANLNFYPNYYYTLLVQIFVPKLLAVGAMLTYYLRNSPLRVTMLRESTLAIRSVFPSSWILIISCFFLLSQMKNI